MRGSRRVATRPLSTREGKQRAARKKEDPAVVPIALLPPRFDRRLILPNFLAAIIGSYIPGPTTVELAALRRRRN